MTNNKYDHFIQCPHCFAHHIDFIIFYFKFKISYLKVTIALTIHPLKELHTNYTNLCCSLEFVFCGCNSDSKFLSDFFYFFIFCLQCSFCLRQLTTKWRNKLINIFFQFPRLALYLCSSPLTGNQSNKQMKTSYSNV